MNNIGLAQAILWNSKTDLGLSDEAYRDLFGRITKIEQELDAEVMHYRKALADIYNRIPIAVGTEPIIASGLCYDIAEFAMNGLKRRPHAVAQAFGGKVKRVCETDWCERRDYEAKLDIAVEALRVCDIGLKAAKRALLDAGDKSAEYMNDRVAEEALARLMPSGHDGKK